MSKSMGILHALVDSLQRAIPGVVLGLHSWHRLTPAAHCELAASGRCEAGLIPKLVKVGYHGEPNSTLAQRPL